MYHAPQVLRRPGFSQAASNDGRPEIRVQEAQISGHKPPGCNPPRWGAVAASLCCMVFLSPAAAQDTRPSQSTTRPAMVAYQRGIRIDWQNRHVEADGQVILREGPLELFACSPGTREHESIVCIDGNPLHLFQAMGLIGITPGRPSRFDPDSRRYFPASGDPVEIEVRYLLDGRIHIERIERWMRRVGPENKPDARPELEPLPWVFAGSYTTSEGVFTAKTEGTVIALVDFSSSLVALPEYHSDSNAELWLAPAAERIPPIGTRCTLILRSAPCRLELDSAGRVRMGGSALSMADVVRSLREIRHDNPAVRLTLNIDPQCPPTRKQELLAILDLLDITPHSVTASQANTPPPFRHDARALGRWIQENRLLFGQTAASRPESTRTARQVASQLAIRARILQIRAEDLAAWLDQLSAGWAGMRTPASAPVTANP